MTRMATVVMFVWCGLGLLSPGQALAQAPDWCKSIEGKRLDVAGLDHALKGDDILSSLHDLVGALCKPDFDAKAKHDALEAQRQMWSQKLLLSDADWADVATWATAEAYDRGEPGMRSDGKKHWSGMEPLDQYALLSFYIGKDYDANYMADALGDKISEAGRLAYIGACLRSTEHEVQWAMCQPDIDAFDFKKLAAEISADKSHTGIDRTRVRIAGYRLADKLTAHATEVKAAKDRDPAYAQMWKIADDTRKTWVDLARTDAALLDLMLTMDDARVSNSRRAFEGCEDKTWAAWKTAVGGIPAKKFGAVQTDQYRLHYAPDLIAVVGSDPEGYLAASALYECGSTGKRDPVLRYIGEAFQRWPGYRGPRTATHSAILAAGIVLDDRAAKVTYPDCYRQWFERNWGSKGGGSGTIATAKPQGELVRIEFAPKMEQQVQCAQTKRSNRITAIRADGSLVYEVTCLREQTVTVNKASAPQTVKARYMAGVHAGERVLTVEDAAIAVWGKPGSAPTMIGGAPVK